ncbi:MAG: hypothetical protein R3F62_31645 [Planctomycetota bacterium]
MSSDARAAPAAVLVVPGYAVEGQTAPLHAKAKARARLAARVFRREGSQVLLLSGGNVHHGHRVQRGRRAAAVPARGARSALADRRRPLRPAHRPTCATPGASSSPTRCPKRAW